MKGEITVTEQALNSIVGLAAHEVPGVVGMSPVGIRDGLGRILGMREASEGVVVRADPQYPGRYAADIYVVLVFGVNIPAVVESVTERAEWAAKQFGGRELSRVNVHVVGVSRA